MKNHTKITKAVIALAGHGTRFLPATKNQPKQMLPIIDKPIIQYVVEEAVESGIKDIILVTQAGQHIMEDYFDNNVGLEVSLREVGKNTQADLIQGIPQIANFVYIRQKKHLPYGNGTPLLVAQNLIDDDEAFVYMFGDDLTLSATDKPVTQQLIETYEQYQPAAVVAVQEVDPAVVDRYGVVKYKENPEVQYEIEDQVEKPKPEEAPSNMAVLGRYIFTNDLIKTAQITQTGKDNELWVTDMLRNLIANGKKVLAPPINGEWITTGDPLNYLKATVKFAMQRSDLAEDFKEFLDQVEKPL